MKKYCNVKYGTKVERRNYSKMKYDLDLPNLIEIQTKSFQEFLDYGIQASLKSIFPIESYNGDLKLHFNDFFLEEPKFNAEDSKKRGFTYSAELFLNVTLENVITKQTKKARILMTDLPLMTIAGTFIINGTERVVVSQIVRSAGAYFTSKLDNKINKNRFTAQIIPTRGAWIEFEQNNKDFLYAKLDRSKKIPLTKFIHALGFDTQEEIEKAFGINSLLDLSFKKDNDSNCNDAIVELYSKLHQGERVPTNAAREFIRTRLFDKDKYDLSLVGRYKLNRKLDVLNRAENTFLAQDIKDLTNNKILFPAGTFLNYEIIKQLALHRDKFRVELVNSDFHLQNQNHDENIFTYRKSIHDNQIYIKEDIVHFQTGQVLVKADTLLDDNVLNTLLETHKYNIDDKIIKYFANKEYINKVVRDRQKVFNESLEVYILDNKNNKSFIKIVGNDQSEDAENIVLSDIIASISYYLNLYHNIGTIDDIDHLGNRRLRLIGELLKNQLRVGLNRTKKNIKDRMSISKFESITPGGLFNFSSLSMAIKTFFCSSRLSHFMDQINPLAIITQKRRISALGSGGIDRDRAGVELRDVNDSYYGRLCPIETPEGPSIGLICSLATYAQVDKYGFIETPFFKVIRENGKSVVSPKYEYLTSIQEENRIIATSSSCLNDDFSFKQQKVIARRNGEISLYNVDQIDYIDVSPKQIVSVATASIPFLEHNDASRALMGANMQRQALPLLISEAPIVATGIEHRIVKDSGCVVIAEDSGFVVYVDAKKIIIQNNHGEKKVYILSTFDKSNQDTLILQKPIVKFNEYVNKGDIIADGSSTHQGELALGKNVTVAFMTWDGYNYEDAVILSERLVQEDIFTSVHISKYEIQVRELKKGAGREEITHEIPNVSAEAIKNLDSRGIIIPGSEVNEGDYLVGKIVIIPQSSLENNPYEKLIQTIIGEKSRDYKDASLKVPCGESGIVQSVQYFSVKKGDFISTPGVNEIIKVYIAKKRKIREGDKIAGRHGNKGVISCIAAKVDMPYMSDGTPIDVILNPLGVPSRMNIGQILEMHLGMAAHKLNIKVATPVLDGANNEDLKNIMQEANLPFDGKMTLYDGRTGEPYDNSISVGILYMLKLSHMVEDKIHARNVGTYTLILQQPGSGRNFLGGQRIGEMETWSLLAYGAAHTLQEILTLKSDDIIGRNQLYHAIVNGLRFPKPSIPESFRVFTKELQALGLHVELIKADTKDNQINRSLVSNNKENKKVNRIMLNMKIEDFALTKRTLKNLKSIGINSLGDINNYHLNELITSLNEESFEEFVIILKKYGLPESLNNLNLNKDILDVLYQNNILNCYSLLTTDKDALFKLFNHNHSHLNILRNVLDLYNLQKNNIHNLKNKIDNSVVDKDEIIWRNENQEHESASSWVIDKAIFPNNSNREYDYFKIRLSSPHEIRQKSYGEVVNYETINYRTAKPEKGGLFCPIIFGPVQDLQCICSKKQTLKKGQTCSKCGVEITEQLVRRERMGHIDLAAPVVHTWFLNSLPSRLAILLGMKAKELAEIVYYVSYIVINPGNSDLNKYSIISELEYGQYLERCDHNFVALTGAEAVKTMLQELNMEETIKTLRLELKQASKQKRDLIVKRLELMESFYQSDNKPEWIVLEAINVIPPSLRPIVALEQGVRFASADINDLYRRILNRNNRLKRQLKQNAPRLIIKNEKRMLQEAVDALFDNAKSSKKSTSNIERNKPLKSLSEMLRGKQGRFRQNLLGKRVDYSGRSVIIVGPDLKLHQCGIPRQMAIVLFKPFVLNKLQEAKGIDKKSANILYEKMNEHVWKLLEEVVQEHPVLLNRAPTLHRQGLQGFQVKLIDGKAIRLHPLVTLAFNADFDGDQMAVYVPLSVEAQAEARLLMLSSYNILDPKNGSPVLSPSQDMVLGNYYLTIEETRKRILKGYNSEIRNEQHQYKHRNEGKVFNDLQEAELAFYNKQIALHTRILVRTSKISSYFNDEQKNKYLVTTLGKLIFNSILPNDFPYLQEPTIFNLETKTPDIYFIPKGVNLLEYLNNIPTPEPFKKRFLSLIIDRVFKRSNISETSKMLDDIKNLGFKYSTMSGVTISHADINVYSKKAELISQVEDKITEIEKWHDKGFLTTGEKKSLIIQEWKNVRNVIQEGLMQEFNQDNHLFMISDSGARGNVSNFSQLSGMRGLMHSPTNNQLEIPVKSSFKEGLNVHEFFISTHGARKVSTDTALKTAESGYLTRRLVDVAQDVIIMSQDCGSDKGVYITSLEQDGKEIISLQQRLFGRYIAQSIVDSSDQKIIVNCGELITREIAENIVKMGFLSVKIRSVLTCNSDYGICAKCYGLNLATNKEVEIGEAVGIIAAQSIGEPGTQLTMRTFHTGGVLSVSDITQGLPRIQELFEARKPKGKALISEYDGVVKEIKSSNIYSSDIVIASAINPQQEYTYTVDSNVDILVQDGMSIKAGQRLTSGSIDLRELLRISSVVTTQKYILEEVQQVYQSQSVYISDKHIEIIIRQMFKQILIISEGDSNLLPGSEVSIKEFKRINMQLIQQNKKLAAGRPIVLGITRSSLKSDSLLSAASFQETTKILIDATIKGQKDFLLGLKENVILGGLIPAGTGILNHSLFEYPLIEDDKS